MASSNRHWPSMFKSKPCNTPHQWQHDLNPTTHISSCQRAPFSGSGNEERSPDPKPRWNPKPEQIRILEAIFNSGMVNPPRDEIRRIRSQLQEYGQVGDANVFYWFQNRKSRSKNKQRNSSSKSSATGTTLVAPSSSSSSSSEKSPPKKNRLTGIHLLDSPTASVNNQTYFQTQGDFSTDPFFYPMPPPPTSLPTTQGNTNLFFPELANIVHHIPDQVIGPCTGFLLSELFNQTGSKSKEQNKLSSYPPTITTTTTTATTTTLPSTSSINMNLLQGVGLSSEMVLSPPVVTKSTVYINNVAFEVTHGPFNVRETFGDGSVLIHSNGQPVVTNEWGLTLQSLQPGACYYLV